ncbi:MAG: glycosyltransferase family 4 protein [Rhizobiaceae bacterium]|nr:glycosyltransferase family 4 protein [Rhizobiaceae bacterium]
MRIAFYAPLKSPVHPVPSGDRQMARMLMRSLELAGHDVSLASAFRAYRADPLSDGGLDRLVRDAAAETETITRAWELHGAPDLWFSYHSYYKAPDLLGPSLAERFGLPMVTAEASYAGKRDVGPWAAMQAAAMRPVLSALRNVCFTARDFEGLARIAPRESLAMLFPFIDTQPFAAGRPACHEPRIVTIAMMRPGDKMASYRLLAAALRRIADRNWTLRVIGDGPCRAEVEALFSGVAENRIEWLGERRGDEIPGLLEGTLFAWPGCGEAYGLAYLEAQAAGLPVVAQATAGVPEVVRHGETGLLTPEDDTEAYASALAELLASPEKRREMGVAARRFVLDHRSLPSAATRLSALLQGIAPHER